MTRTKKWGSTFRFIHYDTANLGMTKSPVKRKLRIWQGANWASP